MHLKMYKNELSEFDPLVAYDQSGNLAHKSTSQDKDEYYILYIIILYIFYYIIKYSKIIKFILT